MSCTATKKMTVRSLRSGNEEDVRPMQLNSCAFQQEYSYRHSKTGQAPSVVMAPKAEKQPAKKSVSKVGGAKSGRKKGSKKAIESYKIYIYKVRLLTFGSRQ